MSNCTKDDDATAAARRRAGFADDKYPLKGQFGFESELFFFSLAAVVGYRS